LLQKNEDMSRVFNFRKQQKKISDMLHSRIDEILKSEFELVTPTVTKLPF
jgi:hypothetical protein